MASTRAQPDLDGQQDGLARQTANARRFQVLEGDAPVASRLEGLLADYDLPVAEINAGPHEMSLMFQDGEKRQLALFGF